MAGNLHFSRENTNIATWLGLSIDEFPPFLPGATRPRGPGVADNPVAREQYRRSSRQPHLVSWLIKAPSSAFCWCRGLLLTSTCAQYRPLRLELLVAIVLVLYPAGLVWSQESVVPNMEEVMLIDDFNSETSRLGTSWEGFTDQVMGGVSEMTVVRANDTGEEYVRMRGDVSTKNNGGFIQIRLKLSPRGVLDGSSFEGLRLVVRGRGSGYYIFLRTANTILPWKFFKAEIPVTEEWRSVDIPWTAFGSGDYGRAKTLKTNQLKSVALVAYGKDFTAEVDLRELSFYR